MNSEALEFIFPFQLAMGTNTIQVALQSQLRFLWPELWVVSLKNQNLYANKVSECLVRGWLHSTQSKTYGTRNKWKPLNLHSSNAWKWDYCIFCNCGTKYYGGNFITDNNEHIKKNPKNQKTPTPKPNCLSSIYRSQAEYKNLTGKNIILWMGTLIGKYWRRGKIDTIMLCHFYCLF